MSLVAYQSSSEESDDEQDVDRIKASSRSNTSLQPKRKEPVKIAIPSLDELDVEHETPTKKPKIKASSGLLSLLPAPKFSSSARLANLVPPAVKKKEAERKLPNVFTASSSSSVKSNKLIGTVQSENSSIKSLAKEVKQSNETDENALSSNFFGFDKKSLKSSESTSDKDDCLPTDFFSLDSKSDAFDRHIKTVSPTVSGISGNHSPPGYESSIPVEQMSSRVYSEHPKDSPEVNLTHNVYPSSSWTVQDSSSCASSNEPPQIVTPSSSEIPHEAMPADIMKDERFLRLQGRRKKEFDDIDIIDVNVDNEFSDRSQWLTKSITEEKKVPFSRKKGELPTQQQRRKHQITYLAFQAKERELDLKNQWAQNRLTKRETQSKYGF